MLPRPKLYPTIDLTLHKLTHKGARTCHQLDSWIQLGLIGGGFHKAEVQTLWNGHLTAAPK